MWDPCSWYQIPVHERWDPAGSCLWNHSRKTHPQECPIPEYCFLHLLSQNHHKTKILSWSSQFKQPPSRLGSPLIYNMTEACRSYTNSWKASTQTFHRIESGKDRMQVDPEPGVKPCLPEEFSGLTPLNTVPISHSCRRQQNETLVPIPIALLLFQQLRNFH